MDQSLNHFTLSICIATVNRAGSLVETLATILPQITREVEIVVVDGGSTDATPETLRSLQEGHPNIQYIRLPEKGGVDQDYTRAVASARGEYCWLMTDDDLLKPGALRVVLDATVGKYSLVIVNAEVRTADLGKQVAERRLRIAEDRVYEAREMERFFQDNVDYLSYIGGVVIRRDVWNERDKAKYFGSLFVHVGVIFQRPLPGRALVLAEPHIVIRYGTALWSSRSFEIWMFLWPKLLWSFESISDSVKRKIEPEEPWRRLTRLLLFRAEGMYGMAEYREYLAGRIRSRWDRVVGIAAAVAPGGLLNALGILYYSILRKESGVQLVDLRNSRFYYRRWLRGALHRG